MSSPTVVLTHPVTYFHPSHWRDQFLNLVPLDLATKVRKEEEIEHLKEEVRKDLVESADIKGAASLEQLNLIDAIERLGVAYHFKKEIEEALNQIYESYHIQSNKDDLYHLSTRFRILRQHGFNVSSDVFKKYKDDKGGFKCSIILNEDVKGILSLYEASHVRTHGDDILDEACVFTTTYLNSVVHNLNSALGEEVAHALHQPLHKGFLRLESKHYISFYQQHPSHNATLLKLAKLDFNLLQSMHQKELQDISGWWEELHSKLPFTRDRLVEAYFWILGIYYEPEYLRARQFLFKIFIFVQIFDDIFDAYGSFEILQLFAEAVDRWDYRYIAKLPQYFNTCCQVLFETLDTYEKELAQEGKAYAVHYYRQLFKRECQAWLGEAKWKKEKYTPTFEEYMKTAIISVGQIQGIVGSYLGMGSIANKESFDWVCQHPMPKLVEASLVIIRLLNDVGSTQFEQTSREHVVSSVQCYMKENGVSNQNEVYEILEKKVEDAWKHLNHGIFRPFVIPKPLLDRILNLARAPEVFYKERTDGYTIINQVIKDKITAFIFDPIN